jgi:RNA polymerase sigma-70 factor (ECF subfamily)
MAAQSNSDFHTTRWTLVLQATGHSDQGQRALSDLCAAYYEPVVAFLRATGRDADAAREMAHGFFEELLAKPQLSGAERARGQFRSYLLGALKHYLSHLRERQQSQKRGRSAEIIPLESGTETSPGIDPPDDQTLPPDREFDRQWALHILQRAMVLLEQEWTAGGRATEFAQLQPFIGGDAEHGAIALLAEQRGENAATLRKTISRLRHQFRQLVKSEITPTISSSDEADAEMRELLAALG